MISFDYVTAWRGVAPWVANHQVEQDLVISRALTEIFREPALARRLAFRGGTALYKLHLRPAARYSEDIDLVQITSEPVGETLDMLRLCLDPWLGKPRRELKEGRVLLAYRFNSEEMPPKPLRLKVEINSREHFTELGYVTMPFDVRSEWWSGSAGVTTFAIDELLGTKMRALFQRRKGRDLFDLWHALVSGMASPSGVVRCFSRYMSASGLVVSRETFEENLRRKLSDDQFRGDMAPLLRPGVVWDVDDAGEYVSRSLIALL